MTITFQKSLDDIARLVKQFDTNRADYLAPRYKEAQARQALIDPLFIVLGWDVHNSERVLGRLGGQVDERGFIAVRPEEGQ
jgi:predicted type IV restriction endonuclease